MGASQNIVWWTFLGGVAISLIFFGAILFFTLLNHRRLKRTQEFTQRVIDTTSAYIVLFTPAGELVQTNQAFQQVLASIESNKTSTNFFSVFDISASDRDKICSSSGVNIELDVKIHTEQQQSQSKMYIDWIFRPFEIANDERLLILGTGINITTRKLAEKEITLQKEQLQSLSKQLFNAQENERERIARELHDEFGQSLTALRVNLIGFELDLPQSSFQMIEDRFQDSKDILESTMINMRNLAHELRPSLIDDVGLVAAIRSYTSNVADRMDYRFKFESTGTERKISRDAEIIIYRIVQEACTNIVKHAQASRLTIAMQYTRQDLRVMIQDDGTGFTMSAKNDSQDVSHGIGLVGMYERIASVNGKLNIDSVLGEGTTIIASVPYGGEYGEG